jgi:hypothetical protein
MWIQFFKDAELQEILHAMAKGTYVKQEQLHQQSMDPIFNPLHTTAPPDPLLDTPANSALPFDHQMDFTNNEEKLVKITNQEKHYKGMTTLDVDLFYINAYYNPRHLGLVTIGEFSQQEDNSSFLAAAYFSSTQFYDTLYERSIINDIREISKKHANILTLINNRLRQHDFLGAYSLVQTVEALRSISEKDLINIPTTQSEFNIEYAFKPLDFKGNIPTHEDFSLGTWKNIFRDFLVVFQSEYKRDLLLPHDFFWSMDSYCYDSMVYVPEPRKRIWRHALNNIIFVLHSENMFKGVRIHRDTLDNLITPLQNYFDQKSRKYMLPLLFFLMTPNKINLDFPFFSQQITLDKRAVFSKITQTLSIEDDVRIFDLLRNRFLNHYISYTKNQILSESKKDNEAYDKTIQRLENNTNCTDLSMDDIFCATVFDEYDVVWLRWWNDQVTKATSIIKKKAVVFVMVDDLYNCEIINELPSGMQTLYVFFVHEDGNMMGFAHLTDIEIKRFLLFARLNQPFVVRLDPKVMNIYEKAYFFPHDNDDSHRHIPDVWDPFKGEQQYC